jgi:tetratricopeptide (TPR) repeat protein
MNVENFDDLWGQFGQPALVEQKLLELLPQACKLENKSIYLQMLSQLALAQACQQKFDQAHATLDQAESLLSPGYELAHVRILCERGRAFQQAGDIVQARIYFEKSYELSVQSNFDKQTINAAHMIAIVAQNSAEKIAWNCKALDFAMSSDDASAQIWKGPLFNNLGANYLEIKDYENALQMFELALQEFEKDPIYGSHTRFAKFRVAQVLRMLEKYDQALALLQSQLQEYDQLAVTSQLGMPQEMFVMMRGWLYEELAIVYAALQDTHASQKYAQLALRDLAGNAMFAATDVTARERIEKLEEMGNKNNRS